MEYFNSDLIYLNFYCFESMVFFDINIVLLNSLSQTISYDTCCYSQFNALYESNLLISNSLLMKNNIIYLNNYYLIINNFYFSSTNIVLFIIRKLYIFDIMYYINIENLININSKVIDNYTLYYSIESYFYFKEVYFIFNHFEMFKFVDVFWNYIYVLIIDSDYVLIKKSINLIDFFIKYSKLEHFLLDNILVQNIIKQIENVVEFFICTEIQNNKTGVFVSNADCVNHFWSYNFSFIDSCNWLHNKFKYNNMYIFFVFKFSFSVWFIMVIIILFVNISKFVVNYVITNNIIYNTSNLFRYVFKNFLFIRLRKLIKFRKQNFNLLWNAYKIVFLKSQDLKLTTNIYLWPYLVSVKNRHNMETWRIYHNKVYMYELALVLLNLKLRVLFYYYYFIISLVKYFIVEIVKILPLFVFESVFKIIMFNKKVFTILIKNKITYNFYRNMWSGLVVIIII